MNELPQLKATDVIKTKPDGLYLGENKITEQEFNNIKEEVAYITKTRIWDILTNTLGDIARQTMFEKATNFDDMRWGKAILYAIDVQEKIMKIFSKTLVAK